MWSHAPKVRGMTDVRGWRITSPATTAGATVRSSRHVAALFLVLMRLEMHRSTWGIGGQMITDEKRRRVAHTLRQIDHVTDDETWDRTMEHEVTMLYMIRDAVAGWHDSVLKKLADLIDRPGCRNVADLEKEAFRCSRCGCRVLATGSTPDGVLVVTSEAFPVDWCSCPACGAVVRDD